MTNIAILLATYNGEKYIREQLDSLLAQTCQDWHLYVHDDGSRDATVALVRDYVNHYPDKITILDYPPTGGPCNNFLSLMRRVEARYYMFCDQDDVWQPEKIELSLRELEKIERLNPEKGIAVYTDLTIVDEHLAPLSASMWEHSGVYPQHLRTFADCGGHTVIATGCAMMFNDRAKKCCDFPADKALMHDIWVCLCVLRCGGVLKGIGEKTVLYRQHGSNTLGATGLAASRVGVRYRLLHLKKVFNSNRNYYAMLASLGYGSWLKYVMAKIRYKRRIMKIPKNS